MPRLVPRVSGAYYRLTWSDSALTIPGVKPFIFVGLNISADDTANRPQYYFQDTLSHAQRGSVADAANMRAHDEIEPYVVICNEDELDSEFLTLDQVVSALLEAHQRTRSGGKGS